MKFYKIPSNIKTDDTFLFVYHSLPEGDKLSNEIKIFNEEIKWDGMWSVEDSITRFKQGWLLITYEIENTIKGWLWINLPNKEIFNLYVNKNFRGRGIAKSLYMKVEQIANENKLDILYADIENWNLISINLIKKMGWKEIKE